MFKKLMKLGVVTFIALIVSMQGIVYAGDLQTGTGTAIDKILEYKTGLELTDKQVKKLTKANVKIVSKMYEAKRQAEIRKTEIDDFTANWTSMHGTAVNHLIKEYYGFLADYKRLELEAISKARAILERDQLRKYTELSSIEIMMLMFNDQLAGMY